MVGTVKHYLEESFWKLKEMGILEWNSYRFSHLITLGKPTEHSFHEGIKKQKISICKTFLGACPLKARDGHGQCQYVIGFPNFVGIIGSQSNRGQVAALQHRSAQFSQLINWVECGVFWLSGYSISELSFDQGNKPYEWNRGTALTYINR